MPLGIIIIVENTLASERINPIWISDAWRLSKYRGNKGTINWLVNPIAILTRKRY
jgi:hypothetical protein